MAIGLHVCGSWNITKQKKIEKIIQCPFMKSLLLWYGSGFFLKKSYCYAFIAQKCKKIPFLNEISSKNFKSSNGLWFNSCIPISYTIKKFTQEFYLQPLFWSIYVIFSKFCVRYYFFTNIFHTFKIFIVFLIKKN